jgi:hypothetical protein
MLHSQTQDYFVQSILCVSVTDGEKEMFCNIDARLPVDTSGIKSASSAVSCSFKSAFAILMLRTVPKEEGYGC